MKKRKNKILIIIFILLVSISLIGITYAYFLTRIIGNSSTTSISGTLGKIEITYEDGNGVITANDLFPGESISKSFTVTNTGNQDVDSFGITLENITNTFERKKDLIYTLKCSSNISEKCNGVSVDIFPSQAKTIVSNSIKVKEVQNYEIVVTYKNLKGIDQAIDMEKSLETKINISNDVNVENINPYEEGTFANTLVYKILMNNEINKTLYESETNVGRTLSDSSPIVSYINDNYGKSLFYRGDVEDNYLTFADMCWRIVRIQGDGSIKIVLQDKNGSCSSNTSNGSGAYIGNGYFGFKSQSPTVVDYVGCSYDSSTKTKCIRTQLQNWFNGKFTSNSSSQTEPSNVKPALKSEYEGKIKYETWQLNDWTTKYNTDGTFSSSTTSWYFEPYVRLVGTSENNRYAKLVVNESPNNITFNDYVSILSADEYVLAGSTYNKETTKYYLYNNYTSYTWTLTPSFFRHGNSGDFDNAFCISSNGGISNNTSGSTDIDSENYIRPSIILEKGVQISGQGTKENPYVVK